MSRRIQTSLATILLGSQALGTAGLAHAGNDRARVIRSVPVVQQVAVPQQVCQDHVVSRPARTSGAGALIGGLAGGAIGNTVGDGSGRAIATAVGLVGGAVLGNHIEGRHQRHGTETVTRCHTQTRYETRTVGYDVTYRYRGRHHTTRMDHDPGRFVRIGGGHGHWENGWR